MTGSMDRSCRRAVGETRARPDRRALPPRGIVLQCIRGQSMTDQLTVRLSPELNHALRAAARQMQCKTSEIVRMALRQYLALPGPEGSRPAERVRGLIGSLDSGVT